MATGNSLKHRVVRKVVPSVPVLARTPVAAALDAADRVIKVRHPEWEGLPPASLRLRIGTGDTLLRNHSGFLRSGQQVVEDLAGRECLGPDSRVLELGCGCGRNAIALRDYLGDDGRYIGQDVDREMIDWCRSNLANDRFSFFHANVYSRVYNPSGVPMSGYALPAPDGSQTLVLAVSVFSHLLYDEFAHYVRECSRVLEPGGRLYMTLFLMDYIRPRLGGRWSFKHRAYKCYVENKRFPEAAVAYDLAVVRPLLSENGFETVEIDGEDSHQQTMILERK